MRLYGQPLARLYGQPPSLGSLGLTATGGRRTVLVRAAAPSEYGWLTERTGYRPGSGFRGILAERAGRGLGFVGFDGWTPSAVWMHVAVDVPAACRGLLRAAFSYVFLECDKQQALGMVASDNARVLRLTARLGFRECGRLVDAWAQGVDLVQLRLRREDCRWIGRT